MKLPLHPTLTFVSSIIFFCFYLPEIAQAQFSSFSNLEGYRQAKDATILNRLLQSSDTIVKLPQNLKNSRFSLGSTSDEPYPAPSELAMTEEESDIAWSQFYAARIRAGYDLPQAMVGDSLGNTYITGGSSNPEKLGSNIVTLKIDSQGKILWKAQQPNADFVTETAIDIALDAHQNVLVAGTYWNGHDYDFNLLKYSSSGSLLWHRTYEGEGKGVDIPVALVVDQDGSVAVTGMSWSGNSINYNKNLF